MQAMFGIELIFLAIGLLLGCAMKQYKLSSSAAVAIILVTYFMSILSSLQEDLDFLKYFTPFKYFDAGALFRQLRYLIVESSERASMAQRSHSLARPDAARRLAEIVLALAVERRAA